MEYLYSPPRAGRPPPIDFRQLAFPSGLGGSEGYPAPCGSGKEEAAASSGITGAVATEATSSQAAETAEVG